VHRFETDCRASHGNRRANRRLVPWVKSIPPLSTVSKGPLPPALKAKLDHNNVAVSMLQLDSEGGVYLNRGTADANYPRRYGSIPANGSSHEVIECGR
jgi:hypothetical protein